VAWSQGLLPTRRRSTPCIYAELAVCGVAGFLQDLTVSAGAIIVQLLAYTLLLKRDIEPVAQHIMCLQRY
jgi:hypothetical protein